MRKYIEDNLNCFRDAIKRIGGKYESYILENPATQKEIDHIESKLGCSLPVDLKEFATTVSRKISFYWSLPDEFELPGVLDEIFRGEFNYDISAIPVHEKYRADWQKECLPNPDDPYDVIWHNKLAFHDVPNGDYLAFDESGQVVYLSHDDGEGHGYIMARSFTELIKNWLPLGCPGPEDWQWLPFVSRCDSGIDPNCNAAKKWLMLMGME